MSLTDRALGRASKPTEGVRTEVTKKARWAASPADWLSLALDQHEAIRRAFGSCRNAASPADRSAAARRLALVLNGHAMAEELVLYPALALCGDKLVAGQAYAEQTAAKLQMAELERLDPSTAAWLGKLEQIERLVLSHMHEEERSWFLDLKVKAQDQAYLARRFQEEFERYVADSGAVPAPAEPASFNPVQMTTGQLDRH